MTTAALPRSSVVHRYFEVSLFLLLTVSFLSLASTGNLDLTSTVVMSLTLIVKALRYRAHREPELSPKTVRAFTAAYFLFYLIDFNLLSGGWPDGLIPATAHLVLFLAVMKVFSARSNRDYLWLTLIAFLQILAAATLTVDLTFLVFFLLFLTVGVSTFISFEIKRGMERARSAPVPMGTTIGRRLERSLLVTSTTVAMSTLVLSVIWFFLLPRVTAGYMGVYGPQPEQISGFSNEVSLGDIGSIKRDPTVVMRIRPTDGDAGSLAGLKWRGIALSQFDGKRWITHTRYVPPVESFAERFVFPRAPFREGKPARPRRLRYRVLLEPLATSAMFAATVPLEISGRFRQLGQDETGSIFNRRSSFALQSYDVVSDTSRPQPDALRASPTGYPENIRRIYLQLPEVDPRVVELTQQVTARFDNPYDKASALERYLRSQFGYTLDLPTEPEDDPIASFLLVRRKGHCEYFAAAMVVMLRTQGIPSRLVNGFLTGEYNEVAESYIVRASHAHTWVEVYFPGAGWVEFDPTPPDPNAEAEGWLTTLAHYVDTIDLWWDEWVVQYDDIHQRMLARSFVSEGWEARRWLRQKRRQATNQMYNVFDTVLSSPLMLPVLLLAGVGVVLLLHGRELLDWARSSWLLRRRGARALSPREATLLYSRLLGTLRRKGYRKRGAQTPLEFAASLPPPELAAHVREFTALYNQTRFGEQVAPAARLAELLRDVRAWRSRT
ncbi:MAG TPA: DUF3488 and transglutaminase-like domain-containing protein [Candidatus Xenobia bacterium]|nr:DUF3488 and transglutaminase-like domain-containing protein [Candidatus Xenobia bacterium]